MRERLSKLLTVKSIVTIMLAVVFSILALRGIINGEQFLTIFTMIISFYYGTQAERKETRHIEEKDSTL